MKRQCSCGKRSPEDGGAEGVCECCSGCSTGQEGRKQARRDWWRERPWAGASIHHWRMWWSQR